MNDTTRTAPGHAAAPPSTDPSSEQHQLDTEMLVRGIAWTSIAIGAAELLVPGKTQRAVSAGAAGWWMRLRGLRSIGGGIALLVSDNKARWLHRRSLANALDVVTLARNHDGDAAERARNSAAIVAIGGLTALDLIAAQMTKSQAQIAGPAPDQQVNRD